MSWWYVIAIFVTCTLSCMSWLPTEKVDFDKGLPDNTHTDLTHNFGILWWALRASIQGISSHDFDMVCPHTWKWDFCVVWIDCKLLWWLQMSWCLQHQAISIPSAENTVEKKSFPSTVPVDDLVLLVARTFAGIVMTEFRSYICMGQAVDVNILRLDIWPPFHRQHFQMHFLE